MKSDRAAKLAHATMPPLTRLARAKVNLALHVVGRRGEGYHLLDSLVAFADFGDVVTVQDAPELHLSITGPMAHGLSSGPDNLVMKAAQSCRMAGIGDEISPVALPSAHLVLVNPGMGLGTASVFGALIRRDNAPLPPPEPLPDVAALASYLRRCRNDLQAPALSLVPQIGTVLAALSAQTGCLLARMSGSGATCFGLFATASAAKMAASALRAQSAVWWVQAGALAS